MKVTPVSINPREPAEPVINHPKIAGRLALAGLPNLAVLHRDLAIPPEGNMEVILGRRLSSTLYKGVAKPSKILQKKKGKVS